MATSLTQYQYATDFGWPTVLPFNELSPDAQWDYDLIDRTPPTITARTPARGSTVTNLNQISVTFSEPVSGVAGTDLLVNGIPGLSVTGSGANYTFSVLQPAAGTVNITWSLTPGKIVVKTFGSKPWVSSK